MQQDVVAILPTGYGKSLIYELLPFWHFEKTGKSAVVLVLEPLNVIIEQQMRKLKEVSFFIGNSPYSEIDKDKTIFLFAHPEAVIGKPKVYKFLQNQSNYMYVVVDEAHCILDWGYEFQAIFRDIKQLRAVRPDATVFSIVSNCVT